MFPSHPTEKMLGGGKKPSFKNTKRFGYGSDCRSGVWGLHERSFPQSPLKNAWRSNGTKFHGPTIPQALMHGSRTKMGAFLPRPRCKKDCNLNKLRKSFKRGYREAKAPKKIDSLYINFPKNGYTTQPPRLPSLRRKRTVGFRWHEYKMRETGHWLSFV